MPFAVTEDVLKREAGEFDLEAMRSLALPERGLDSAGLAEVVRLCPNLTELDVSANEIDDANALTRLAQLMKLRITSNSIRSLAFAAKLPNLEQLFLQGNQISHMKEFAALSELPSLRVLYLRNVDGSCPNPITGHLSYRAGAVRQLPRLANLDGERTHLEEEHSTLKKDMPEPTLPPSEIPPYSPWVEPNYWSSTLRATAPEDLAPDQSSHFNSTKRDCRQLLDSATAIIDRYEGFANVHGLLGK